MNLRTAFNRARLSKVLTSALFLGFFQVFSFTPALAAGCIPASTANQDIYTVLTFTSTTTCDWTVPTGVSSIDVFMVGAGGGGGGDGGGGGGGGAAISRSAFSVTAGNSLALTVGTGGAPSVWSTGYTGTDGSASTLVRTSPSATLTANGGIKGGLGPSGAPGSGGAAVNGGFAGGRGGANSVNGNTKGGDGFTGVSNYFSGSKIEYGGGGGGGSYYGANSFTETLGKSGGGNGGASGSGNNQPGNPGRTNSGGGGGGGSANSPQQAGGRGADGVIIIRYATDSANAFPSAVSSALSGRYSPGDLQILDSSRKGWIDSSGTNASVANANFTGLPSIDSRGTSDGANATNSTKNLLVSKGGTGDRVTLSNLPTNYTLFSVARYVTGGAIGRLITANGGNWFSGFYNGNNGCAHHGAWLTSSGCNTSSLYGWQLSTDQLQYFRQNGKDVSLDRDAYDGNGNYISRQSTSTGFGINNDPYGQNSNWEVADVLIFNRELTAGEIRSVENYLSRVNGLTLSDSYYSSETDTAVNFTGNYFRGEYASGMYLNDLFTMESWVKPASNCDGGTYCALFSYENVLVTAINGGTFRYALYGTSTAWQWIDTGVKLPSSEWHHVTLSKVLAGNQPNAIKVYLDGQLAYTNSGSPYQSISSTNSTSDIVRTYDTWWFLGARTDSTRFYGNLDEFKLWKEARSEAQIQSDMHSTDSSSSNLQLYFDFNRSTLSNTLDLPNLANGGAPRSDLDPRGQTNDFEDVKIVSAVGPYTQVKFPRTYLNQFGGWKVPSGIKPATAIVVGGAGGGGFSGATLGAPGGAGGGGGVTVLPTQQFSPSTFVSLKVGQGGIGSYTSGDDAASRNGQSTVMSVSNADIATALGGGGGANHSQIGAGGSSIATGGGGGGSGYTCTGSSPYTPSGTPVNGGVVSSGNNGSFGIWGWGGSGGGARGAAIGGICAGDQAGVPGAGYVDPSTGIEYGRGGNAGRYSVTSAIPGYATPNNGWGGIIAYSNGNSNGKGYNGSAGVVLIRWITASVPTYTKPTNTTLNVGMTETFTVNVASDSSTSMLTRTFKWESSSAGVNGPWTVIKQGTGAANAAFSWIPTDTSTSGTTFQYRLTVTDSDTAGLFITDSSTAYAIINGALGLTGNRFLSKSINTPKNETFTVTNGTPTYKYSLSPTLNGVTLETRTAGFPVLVIAETATIGTFVETLTVTDSVSATFNYPITIKIVGPPTLSNGAELVSTGQVLHIDSGNSASYTPGSSGSGTTGVRDISGAKNEITVNGAALTYSDDYGGILTTGAATYLQYTKRSTLTSWTLEAYIRINSALTSGTCIIANQYTGADMNFDLCLDVERTFFAGFHKSAWTFKRTSTVLDLNTWYHVAATYDLNSTDSNKVKIYLNGVEAPLASVNGNGTAGGSTPPRGDTDVVYIGRLWNANYFVPMSLGAIRIYDIPLTSMQIRQNYDATRARFSAENLNQTKPSQKHNTTTVETFTVTSGGDTKTVTFAVGNRTGIEWTTPDTATVKLTVKPELVVGTYYDTITVTDNFSASTILPVKITISKGDQAKLSIGQYNAYPGRSTYPLNVTGGSGTGALTRTVTESGTAQCVLADGMMLTASKVGKCAVRVVKAGDDNFLAETGTATIFWIEWSDAYATRVPSTPTEIVLTHKTEIIRHNYETLTVTSYTDTATVANTITSARPGQTIRILGQGFVSTDSTSQATFTDSELADRTALTNDYIQVVVPAGAVTGPVIVDTLKGQAIGPTLTILSP